MPRVLYPPTRPLSIGEALDCAFRIFRATLLKCLPYGALAVITGQLNHIYDLASGRRPRPWGGSDPVWWTLYALGALLTLILWNAIILRQYAIVTGRAASMAAELSEGLRRAPAVVLLWILMGLAIGLFLLPPLALPQSYRAWSLLVLSIPATYVGVALSCSLTALLLARKGVLASLTYSVHLVTGNWWRVTAIYSVGIATLAVFLVVAVILAGVLAPLAGITDIAVVTAVSTVAVLAMVSVISPFFAALALALFGDLQVRKEGSDLERRIAGAAAE